MIPTWWRTLVKLVNRNGKALRRGRRKNLRRKIAWRPLIEQFEDRLVPTTISIPATLAGAQNGVVRVPINVDNLNDGGGHTGLGGGEFIVYYDNANFSVNPATDLGLGSVPRASSGWTVSASASAPGYLDIHLNAGTTITSSAGGSLVTINFHVLGTASLAASPIDLAADNSVFTGSAPTATTGISDHVSAAYTLTPSPANNATAYVTYAYSGTDTTDGVVTVNNAAATQLSLSTNLSNITAGSVLLTVTVTALQIDGTTTADTYSGSVHFTSSDGQAILPGDASLISGVGVFSVTLRTAGNQTISAADTGTYNANITGTSNSVDVAPDVASHFVVSAPGASVAGNNITFTVTAEDQFNNTATGYAGSVHFTSTDGRAVLPGNQTVSSGVGTFSATFKTSGNQTITAADFATPAIHGHSGTIAVSPAATTHYVVAAPSAVAAGASFTFTITARDQFGNKDTNYSGTVDFSSTDNAANLPGSSTLSSGAGVFSATLQTGGVQDLLATDHANIFIAGQSNDIIVTTAATHFLVSAPSSATVAMGTAFVVTALDTLNNTAIGYTGTVSFTSSDGAATLPAASALANGVGNFAAIFNTVGVQTITATDNNTSGVTGNITGSSSGITVNAAVASHFVISAASSSSTGSFVFTVTAKDRFNNVAAGYTGTATFSSSDGATTFSPGSGSLSNGIGSFTATLKTPGTQTITATDNNTSGITGNITGSSGPITVTPGVATHFTVAATPSSITAGNTVTLTVTALDQFNNQSTGYTGSVSFSSTDQNPSTLLPNAGPLSSGVGTFTATLTTVGVQTITASDNNTSGVTGSITGNSNGVTVSATVASHFVVTAPNAATAGNNTVFTVFAEDKYNNIAVGYTGTVSFTSNDTAAVFVPAIAKGTLTSGVGSFSVTLKTAGSRSVTATDNNTSLVTGTISGSSGTITVSGATATHFLVTAPSSVVAGAQLKFTVVAEDQFNNTSTSYSGSVTITSTDPNTSGSTQLPASNSLTNGVGVFTATLATAGARTVTATDNNTSGFTGTITGSSSNVTVVAANATHLTVTAASPAVAGGNLFTVTALDAFNNTATGYTGTVTFSVTDTSAVFVPAAAKSSLASGTGTFSVTLKAVGTQTLTVTDNNTSLVTGTMTASTGPIVVSPSTATHLRMDAPTAATTNTPFTFTLTALDLFNNTATGYGDVVLFTTSDPNASAGVLPGSNHLYTFQAGDNGQKIFVNAATLITSATTQTITATDQTTGSIPAVTSAPITVTPLAANHFNVSAPTSVTAGASFNVIVTALDNFSNVVKTYTGTVSLAAPGDPSFSYTAPNATSTLTSGVGTFAATLFLATASQTITASDTAGHSNDSNLITVNAARASHFVVSAPGSVTAGVGVGFTVTAEDQFNNTAVGYAGTATLTSSDPNTSGSTVLPAASVLVSGVGTFTATLATAGTRTLTATDANTSGVTGTITGSSNAVVVSAATLTHFVVTAPGTVVAGNNLTFTVVAEDQFNNTAAGYGGTVQFASSDNNLSTVLPLSRTLSSGVGTFTATLTTAGSQTLTAHDLNLVSITGTSNAVVVSAATASHFVVGAPGASVAGNNVTFTVVAEDRYNNTAVGYTGTATFTSSDHNASTSFPATGTLLSGVGSFSATLTTAGSQTLTATDNNTSGLTGLITGSSGPIVVSSITATHFVITSSGSATAGTGFAFTVTAEDQFNNTAAGYTGTASFTSSDVGISTSFPTTGALLSGQGVFTATLTVAGSQTLTATDNNTSGLTGNITGASGPIVVSAARATHLVVSAPGTATAGGGFSFVVTAEDQFNNTATGYTGTATITSSDHGPSTSLSGAHSLTSGVGTFTATLTVAGSQTLTATDANTSGVTGTITGSSGAVNVTAAVASHFVVSAPGNVSRKVGFGFTVTAEDKYNNTAVGYTGTVTFTSTDSSTNTHLPTPSALTSGVGSFSATLGTLGSQTLTASDNNTSLVTGSITGSSAPITVNLPPATHFVMATSTASTTAGVVFTFTVTAEDQFNATATNYTGTVSFSTSDANFSGFTTLPGFSTLLSGQGTFSATLTTAGTQTLTASDNNTSGATGDITGSTTINITADTASSLVVSAPSFVVANTAFGFSVLAIDQFNNLATSYHGTVAFSASDTAPGSLPGNSTLSSGVGNFSATLFNVGNQFLTATDTVNPAITGSATITVPVTVAIPSFNNAARGSVLTVPINVNALNDPAGDLQQIGLSGGTFVIYYDPSVFNDITQSDAQIGTISSPSIDDPTGTQAGDGYSPTSPNGWIVSVSLISSGSVEITLVNHSPGNSGFVFNTGGGTLVNVNFTVRNNAPIGSTVIDLAADTDGGQPFTSISDALDNIGNIGANYTLFPAPQDNTTLNPYVHFGSDFVDGVINVTAVNLPPVVVNDSYSITEREVGSDPGLSVVAPGVLANDSDPQFIPLTASLLGSSTTGAGGTVVVNSNGSFTYTPPLGYLGADSFQYQASDGFFSTTGTVSLTVTSRLSIPTNLSALQNGTITVPVNLDNPNPSGSGGLIGATVAINFDTTKLTFVGATAGADYPNASWNFSTTIGLTSGQQNGSIAVSLLNTSVPLTPNTQTVGSTLAFLTFTVNANAPQGSTPINIVPSNVPLGGTVVTGLTPFNSGYAMPVRPSPTGGGNDVGVDGSINILGLATHFIITSAPSTATAGVGGAGTRFTVTALDVNNVLASAYTGTVQFSSSDPSTQATLPAATTLSSGTGVFSFTLVTAGIRNLTVTDNNSTGVTGTITGISGSIAVIAAKASHLTVTMASPAVAGGNLFTVTALDAFNNTATGYTGTVTFSVTDTSAVFVPAAAKSSLASGTGTFSVTLKAVGTQTLTVTDNNTSLVTGTMTASTGPIVVSPSTATHLRMDAPTAATTNTPFTFTLTALDLFNNTATGYGDVVLFTTSDPNASAGVLPGSNHLYTFQAGDNGQKIFVNAATLITSATTQTITATDQSTVSVPAVTSAPITVTPLAANHFNVSAPTSVTAGASFNVIVTALDNFSNVVKTYTGTVSLAAPGDPSFSYTAPNATSTLTSGVGTFAATLFLATASQTITASDTAGHSNDSNLITVNAARASHFVVSAPGSVTAGVGVGFTVTAEDQFNNTAVGYAGTATLTSSDPNTSGSTVLPAASVLVSGVGTFTATLATAGTRTLTATDANTSGVTGTITGSSNAVVVSAATLTHFVVTAPGTVVAGNNLTFTVVAEDQFNNTAAGYGGTVQFASSDNNLSTVLPLSRTLSSGVGTFTATLTTAGSQTLTAHDLNLVSITGTSNAVVVSAATASHFVVGAPGASVAGNNVTFTVVAEDKYNNTAVGYTGTATFTSSDHNASTSFPATGTLLSGVGSFSATLTTAGSQTLTATDNNTSGLTGLITGSSGPIVVSSITATHFVITSSGSATAGTGFAFTVTAEDQFNNTAAGYTGTASFTSSDVGISTSFPTTGALLSGQGVFTATLTVAGSQTLTATDNNTSGLTGNITGSSGPIVVSAARASHFVVTGPGAATAGTGFTLTVVAEDQFNNTATGYTGTATVTSSDHGSFTSLSGAHSLTSGVGTFTATLTVAGSQTLTATDANTSGVTGTITGVSGPIVVSPTRATHFVVTAPGSVSRKVGFNFTVTAEDPFNNTATGYTGTVTFTSSDGSSNTSLPTPSALTSGVGSFSATLGTLGAQTLTAVDNNTSGVTGNISGSFSPITVSLPPATHFLTVGSATTTTAGVVFTFTVTAEDQFNATATNYTGTVQFESSDSGPSTVLPAPSTLASGQGVFSATLTTAGNQTVTAFDPDPLTGSFSININPDTASFFVVNAPSFAVANTSFGFTVFAEDKFSNIATGYHGTVNFSASDTAPGSLPGHSTLSSGVGNFSATLFNVGNQFLTATDSVNPAITGSATITVPVTVSIPSFNNVARSATLTVPINVNALNDPAGDLQQIGLSGGTFVIYYNPSVFNDITQSDVQIGTISSPSISDPSGTDPGDGYSPSSPNGWSVSVTLVSSGNIEITLVNHSPGNSGFVFNTGGGTLVNVNFTVRNSAPLGSSVIDLAADSDGGQPFTSISDALDNIGNIGANYNLIPAPQDNTTLNPYVHFGSDFVDGVINITGINLPPVVVNDSYSITEREVGSDPGLSVVAPGVLANDSDPQFIPLTASLLGSSTTGAGGTVVVNSNGSFTYTPPLGYLGADSFQYQASDGFLSTTGTVSLTVTSRLSIPTSLSAQLGGTITVPVNLDNPNPSGSGGLIGATVAIDFDPSVLTFVTATAGADYPGATWNFGTTVGLTGGSQQSGLLAVSLLNNSVPSTPNTNTVGSTLAFLTFTVNSGATLGATSINIVPSNVPLGGTVVTGLTPFNSSYAMPVRPSPTSGGNDVGVDGAVTVTGVANHFLVTAPSNSTAGAPFVISVTAEDSFNNTVASYTGTVSLSTSDTNHTFVPASATLTSGVGIFTVTLRTGGNQTVSASDSSGSNGSATVTVNGAVATHFTVSAPGTVTAGNPFVLVVTAKDQFNNSTANYSGTVHFTSSDPQVSSGGALPGDVTLTNGIGFFASLLETAGTTTITATDTVPASSISGSSGPISVIAAAATHYSLTPVLSSFPGVTSGPTTFAVTGVPLTFSVMAQDQFNNTAPSYAGTAHFTSSDTAAGVVRPADATLVSGVGTFSITLATAGNQTLTATDTIHNSGPGLIAGTSAAFPTRGLVATGVTLLSNGFTVTFDKPFNPNTINLYTASNSTFPDDVVLTTTGTSQVSIHGSALFNATNTSLTFIKSPSISGVGTFNPASGVLSAGTYTLTLRSFSTGSSGFQDSVGGVLDGSNSTGSANFQLTFTVGTPPVSVGIASFARGPSNTDAIFLPSGLVDGVSTFNLSYTNPNTVPTTATATIVFSTNAATLQANIQQALTFGALATQIGRSGSPLTPNSNVVVTKDVASGANILVYFQNALATASSQLLGTTTSGVTIGQATVNLLNSSPLTGIPIAISSGQNVTSGSFTLQYNPSLLTPVAPYVIPKLTVSSGGVTASLTASAPTIINSSTATIVFSLSSPTRLLLNGTTVTLGALLASVPLSATANYGAKQLLHFTSATLNGTGGPITVTNADGIQVVANVGDVVAPFGGILDINDSTGLLNVAGGVTTASTIPGFGAYPDLDPLIIGDPTLVGQVSPGDAAAVAQLSNGATVPVIPYVPIGLPVAPMGPDPVLSVPTNLVAAPGGTVIVPVNIDTAHPDGSTGMVNATLALTYDPKVFDVSADDVQLGSLPSAGSGWQLKAEVNPLTGVIGVKIFSSTPIFGAEGGSLITIAMHVRDTAPAGATGLSLVPFADPNGGTRIYETAVADALSTFVLHPAATAAGLQPGAPGLVTIGTQLLGGDSASSIVSQAGIDNNALVGPNPFDVQSPVFAANLAAASAMPLAALEKVFGGLDRAIQLLQDGAVIQPRAILTSEVDDPTSIGIRDLAIRGSADPTEAEWMPEDCLAYLGMTTRGNHGSLDAEQAALALEESDFMGAADPFNLNLGSKGRRAP